MQPLVPWAQHTQQEPPAVRQPHVLPESQDGRQAYDGLVDSMGMEAVRRNARPARRRNLVMNKTPFKLPERQDGYCTTARAERPSGPHSNRECEVSSGAGTRRGFAARMRAQAVQRRVAPE